MLQKGNAVHLQHLKAIIAASGDFKIQRRMFKEAAEDFEKLTKMDPKDPVYKAKLVITLAKVDPSKLLRYVDGDQEIEKFRRKASCG